MTSKFHDLMEGLTCWALLLSAVGLTGRLFWLDEGLAEWRAFFFVGLGAYLMAHMYENKWPAWTFVWLVVGMTLLTADRIKAAAYLQLPCAEWAEEERWVCTAGEWTQSGEICTDSEPQVFKVCVARVWREE